MLQLVCLSCFARCMKYIIISYYKLLIQCCKVNTPIPDEKPEADRLERIRQVKGMKYTSCLARMAL